MARFEINVYSKDGKSKTHKRDFFPIALYLRWQQAQEKVEKSGYVSDAEMFDDLQPLFLETFPEMTEEEYRTGVDSHEAMQFFSTVLDIANGFTPQKNP